MSEIHDDTMQRSKGGVTLPMPAEHWMEGTDNDGSAGIEWTVPDDARTAKFYSDSDAYFGAVAEASLDISGAGFNAAPLKADQWSPEISVENATKVSVKARTGNLAIVAVMWGGKNS